MASELATVTERAELIADAQMAQRLHARAAEVLTYDYPNSGALQQTTAKAARTVVCRAAPLMLLSELRQHRRREPEWMDAPDVDPRHARRQPALHPPGQHAAALHARDDFAPRALQPPLAAGRAHHDDRLRDRLGGRAAGDRRLGAAARVRRAASSAWTCTRRRATLARAATRHEPRITIVRGDALDPPFDAGSFDYALSSMFLHHLSDDDAVKVLAAMARRRAARDHRGGLAAARAGVRVDLAADAARPTRWCGTMRGVSVAQAFNKAEALQLRDRAGVDFARFYRHFGHRFVLAGERRA